MTSTNTALTLTDTSEELERFNAYLKSIAAGMSPTDAMQHHGLLWREIELVVLGSPLEGERWRQGRLLGQAARWSLLDRDELFGRLARGVPVEKALVEVRGNERLEQDLGEFFELVEALPEFQERFAAAMRANGLRDMQRVEKIAEDMSRDTLDTLKGPIPNMAAVGRDKLRVEALQWRLARLDPERWGERKQNVNVQVNVNHAEVLEGARTRAKVRDKGVTREQMRNAVDAVFKPVEAPVVSEQPVEATKPAESAGNPFASLEE
jgi:hypothetical protein